MGEDIDANDIATCWWAEADASFRSLSGPPLMKAGREFVTAFMMGLLPSQFWLRHKYHPQMLNSKETTVQKLQSIKNRANNS